MSRPVTEDSTSNTDYWKRLRINCSRSISRFRSEGATSGNSDESRAIPDLTTSSTDSESPCIVSPSVSLSSFEVVTPLVAGEDLYCESDLPSSLTQPCLKIDVDLKKYHDQPQDLTCCITRTHGFPNSYGGFSDVWRCKLDSFPRNGIKVC
ncbi:hypothetical protein CY34DRAFT_600270 [Suillus luteus UH-Slu-Lm8-n1]|uniref:Uncharacterized protein n=1 Tax=Suillus luteus UH-Slu-Lm8-n1 TaxID=930992 RepID=A0A0D0AT20_9AGAM|nr:hypothetical protein CY34DRAFT_600270 [Suillus luteus UH-Slu-Lm8-n1]